MSPTVTRTTCPYCGVGCGVLAERNGAGEITVRGDPQHPANLGRLCSKGTALAATLGPSGRLLQPEVDGAVTSWDVALDAVAGRLGDCIASHGPDSVALYVSGQLLTEDYYIANKFVKGYLGTANIDTNSRLCMASAVAGHVRAFGEDVVPVQYSDLDQADLIVLVGSNLAWCHRVLMQGLLAARASRPQMKLVVVDPRRTATCDGADLHLPLRSGTDVMLFNGLLAWLADNGHVDAAFVAEHTNGVEAALDAARVACSDIAATAQICGVDASLVERFFALFAAHERVVTLFSQGVNQSSAGTDKVNSLINCHLFTGRIGRAGMGPFSITGQPNAMGGREVGGLATQLAAHLALGNAEHRAAVQEFWNSPRIADRPGYKAVDLFEAIDAGRIKAVWIIATNPVVSLPDADLVRRALARCPLVIVSDCVADNDTLPHAHIRLPAAAWGEKDGTVTNSDRHVSRQRAFLPPAGAARPDWWIIAQVAQRMGHGRAFAHAGPAEIFAEHARLTAISRSFGLQLDLTGLAGLGQRDYDDMPVTQWPTRSGARPFASGRFPTADGRARFVAVAARAPRHAPSTEYPLILNTGRIRDQWHTMTRTARAPQLNAHEPEPYLDASAQDLAAIGVRPGELVRVVSRWGSALARARASGELPAGMVFMPIHWSGPFARSARVGAAVNPVVDGLSGEPEFKHTPVRLEKVAVEWSGFLLSRARVPLPEVAWWALSPGEGMVRMEFAGNGDARLDGTWLRKVVPGAADADAEWIEFEDAAAGSYRVAVLKAGRLAACLMVTRQGALPPRAWLAALFAAEQIDATDRRCLLLGRRRDAPDPGATVCACHGVGANTIAAAVQDGCDTVDAVGARLRAGTNCGSCRPEIARLIAAGRLLPAPGPMPVDAGSRQAV